MMADPVACAAFVIGLAALDGGRGRGVWEVVENSDFVIQRYREAGALGYFGDTIVNSLGDIAICGFGFVLARSFWFGRSVVLFVAVEVVLLFWVRDSLLLNVLMLIYPVEGIEQWQAGY